MKDPHELTLEVFADYLLGRISAEELFQLYGLYGDDL